MSENLTKHFRFLNIGYWNIQGLNQKVNELYFSKLNDKEFLDAVTNLDLFCLSETHIGTGSWTQLKKFKCFKSCRISRGKNKFSGGLCLFISKIVSKRIKIFKNDDPDILWVKLNRLFFNFEKDLYISFNYISPKNSTYYKKLEITTDLLFDQIRQDIADFRTLGNKLLLGDMNAHSSPTTLDYIDLDSIDDFLPLPEVGQYQPDTPIKRNTLDLKETDNHREFLISLCHSSSLRILNGNRPANSEEHKPSILDFAISDTELIKNRIKYFNVSHLTSISDHCYIKLRLDVDYNIPVPSSNIVTEISPAKYKWVSPYKEKFEDLINSCAVKNLFTDLSRKEFPATQERIDRVTDKFISTLNSIALQVFPQHRRKKKF